MRRIEVGGGEGIDDPDEFVLELTEPRGAAAAVTFL